MSVSMLSWTFDSMSMREKFPPTSPESRPFRMVPWPLAALTNRKRLDHATGPSGELDHATGRSGEWTTGILLPLSVGGGRFFGFASLDAPRPLRLGARATHRGL